MVFFDFDKLIFIYSLLQNICFTLYSGLFDFSVVDHFSQIFALFPFGSVILEFLEDTFVYQFLDHFTLADFLFGEALLLVIYIWVFKFVMSIVKFL